MLSSTYAEVLNIISTAQPTKGMTCAEIYKLTSDNLDTQITDPAQVSKICFAVRNNGFIRTFLADKKKPPHYHCYGDRCVARILRG